MGPPDSLRISRVPRYSGAADDKKLTHKGLSPAMADLSKSFRFVFITNSWQSYNPAEANTSTVWAMPLSLAATRGITFVFSSCGY